ncbi:MAG: histidine--tRNA ligase, partial [Saprospiraceae bacterium]|nr:histidine--tRNA ligase [Saprospiraceae bacterium]
SCDLYPEPAKLKKQMSYANARNVPYVGIIGESERQEGVISLKNMVTGDQNNVKPEALITLLQ